MKTQVIAKLNLADLPRLAVRTLRVDQDCLVIDGLVMRIREMPGSGRAKRSLEVYRRDPAVEVLRVA